MTIPQILFTLNLEFDEPTDNAADQRAKIFTDICTHNHWPLARLRDIPPSELADIIRAHHPKLSQIVPNCLIPQIAQFLNEQG